jgi:hypothetical protein
MSNVTVEYTGRDLHTLANYFETRAKEAREAIYDGMPKARRDLLQEQAITWERAAVITRCTKLEVEP